MYKSVPYRETLHNMKLFVRMKQILLFKSVIVTQLASDYPQHHVCIGDIAKWNVSFNIYIFLKPP